MGKIVPELGWGERGGWWSYGWVFSSLILCLYFSSFNQWSCIANFIKISGRFHFSFKTKRLLETETDRKTLAWMLARKRKMELDMDRDKTRNWATERKGRHKERDEREMEWNTDRQWRERRRHWIRYIGGVNGLDQALRLDWVYIQILPLPVTLYLGKVPSLYCGSVFPPMNWR